MPSDTLLVVDVQCGFINPFTQHIPSRIARLIDTGDFDTILFTRFINTPESPYRRLLDWHAASEAPETDLAPELTCFVTDDNVFDKHGLTGVPEALAHRVADDDQLRQISVVGIDTDMCVLKIAMDLFDLGVEPIVLIDCCASTAGLQAHLAGLAILSRNIGPHQLRLTELNEGYLTSPPD